MREKVDMNAAKLIELIGSKIMFGVVVAIVALMSWNTPVQADAPAAPTDLSARNWWGIVERNSDEGITFELDSARRNGHWVPYLEATVGLR